MRLLTTLAAIASGVLVAIFLPHTTPPILDFVSRTASVLLTVYLARMFPLAMVVMAVALAVFFRKVTLEITAISHGLTPLGDLTADSDVLL
ncbi:MAG: hypothetical protein ACYCOU_10505 [Sulfobacillus sp.]